MRESSYIRFAGRGEELPVPKKSVLPESNGSFKTWFWLLLLLPYFPPAEYVFGSTVSKIFQVGLALSMLVTAALLFRCRVKMRPWIAMLVFAYFVIVASSMAHVQNCDVRGAVTMGLKVASFALLLQVGLRVSLDKFMFALMLVGVTVSTLHAGSMFLFRDAGGMNPLSGMLYMGMRYISNNYYYLGYDTISIFVIYPLLVGIFVFEYRRKGRPGFLSAYSWGITLLSCMIVGTTTSVIALIMFPIFYVAIRRFPRKNPSFVSALLFLAALFVFFVVARGFVVFSDVITDVLGKSMSLTGRVFIWDASLESLLDQVLLGWGHGTDEFYYSFLGISHSHNIGLEILQQGGVVALVAFMAFFIMVGKNDEKSDRNISAIMLASVFSYFILCTFDFYLDCVAPMIIFVFSANRSLISPGLNARSALRYCSQDSRKAARRVRC